MTPRERAVLFSDLDLAFGEIDMAISLVKMGHFGTAAVYIKHATNTAKAITKRLN